MSDNNTHDNENFNKENKMGNNNQNPSNEDNSKNNELSSNIETDYSEYLDNENHEESKENSNNKDNKYQTKDQNEPLGWWERKLQFWKNEGNVGKKILIILLAIILIVLIAVGGYIISRLSMIKTNDDIRKPVATKEPIYEEIDFDMMNDVTDAKSLNEILRKWATNGGQLMSSKNILNFLLIGVDSESTLSDSMMILSVDRKHEQIKLTSFYRDSYTYINPEGKKQYYSKLNAAFASGGAKGVVKTIQDNYKIKIDDYVYVDYSTFPKVIDSLGGVKIKVKPYEARYINKSGYNIKNGIQTLNGDEALFYSRIRKLDADADVSRTRRQRYVISQIIDKLKNTGITKFDSIISTLLPNLTTSLSKTDILGLGTKAITNNWFNYEIKQTAMPTDKTRLGSFIGSNWVWIVDYPGAAHELQMFIYDKSNIKLEEKRKTAIQLKPTTTKKRTTTTTQATTTTTTLPNENIVKTDDEEKPVTDIINNFEE